MNAPSENLSLRWISLDLDERIDTARRTFQAYLSDPEDAANASHLIASLEATCLAAESFEAASMHTAHQLTLEIVGILETLQLSRAVNISDCFEAVIGGFNQLLNFLSFTKRSDAEHPEILLAVINELRSVAGKRLLLPREQFAPLMPQDFAEGTESLANSAVLIPWLLSMQQGLNAIDSDVHDHREALVNLCELTKQLDFVSGFSNHRSILHDTCQAYLALIESAVSNGARLGLGVKYCLQYSIGVLLSVYKETAEDESVPSLGADRIRQQFNEILFNLAIINDSSVSRLASFSRYGLSAALPIPAGMQLLRLGTPDVETIDRVMAGIVDDIQLLQKILQVSVESEAGPGEYVAAFDMTSTLLYTAQLAQLDVGLTSIEMVRSGLKTICESRAVDHQLLESVITELLAVESLIEMRRLGTNRQASELVCLEQMCHSLQAVCNSAKSVADLDVVDSQNTEPALSEIFVEMEGAITEVLGVALFLEEDLLSKALEHVQLFIKAIYPGDLVSVQAGSKSLKESVDLILVYVSSCRLSCHNIVDQALVQACEVLGQALVSSADAEIDECPQHESTFLEESPHLAGSSVDAVETIEVMSNDSSQASLLPIDINELSAAYSGQSLECDIDEDIADIFLEEAAEVMEALVEHTALLVPEKNNSESLAEIRRGYHTLKGSGRMAMAEHLGDAAWAVENLLNAVIEKKVKLDENRIAFVEEAAAYLSVLIQDFSQRFVPSIPALESFIARCELLTADSNAQVIIGESMQLLSAVQLAATMTEATMLEAAMLEATMPETNRFEATSQDVITQDAIAQDERATHPDKASDEDSTQINEQEAHEETIKEEAGVIPVVEVTSNEVDSNIRDFHYTLRDIFFEEAALQLAVITEYTDSLSEDANVVPSERVKRAFHTLVGGSRIAEIQPVANIMESANLLVAHMSGSNLSHANQHSLLIRTSQWLMNFLAGTPDTIELTEQLDEDYHVELERILAASNNTIDAEDHSDLLALSGLIVDGRQFLRAWRSQVSVPTQFDTLISGLGSIADASAAIQPIKELVEAMLVSYQCSAVVGLHYHFYSTLMQAHLDLEDMLDCLAAGQAVVAVVTTDELLGLVKSDEALAQRIAASSKQAEDTASKSNIEFMDDEIVDIFLEESQDLIEELEAGVGEWLNDQNELSYLESLLRPLHTIKGGARMAGLEDVGDICHEFESLLESASNQRIKIDANFFKKVSHFLADLITHFANVTQREQIQSVGHRNGEPGPEEEKRVTETVKVDAQLLEKLVNLAGETSISRSLMEEKTNEFTRSIDEIDATVERLKEQLRRLEIETEAQISFRQEQVEIEGLDEFDPLEMDRYSQFQQISKSLVESASDLKDLKITLKDKTRDIETLLLQQARVNTEMQEGLMRTRTVPLSRAIVPRLRRTIRQVSGELDKPVSFTIGSAEGELDRSVIERMAVPLEHVIRNAIDHGIETTAHRKKSGKPESGSIHLDINREGGDVVIRLSDDGKGIDVDAVKKKALALGLIKKGDELSDDEIKQFIMSAGFSTAAKITQISGRGVGMDVVQKEIHDLGGTLELLSEQGKGTTFIFRLPFTVSMNRALLVGAGGETLAVPLDSIEGIVRVSPYELEEYYGDSAIDFMYAGQRYDFRYLGSLVNGSEPQYSADIVGALPVLLVRSGDKLVAFQVDRLLGSREIVVKSLGPQLSNIEGISGATVLGDGSVVMITDLAALARNAAKWSIDGVSSLIAQPAERDCTLVMVVDDSVTVRKVTTRLLERQGFEVITAKDGLDAIEKLEGITPDIMLLDIEMPRLDGFEVVTRVRHEERLASMPIVMISSRTGDKHRERAIGLGANGFLGKPYQDSHLISTISEFLPDKAASRAVSC
jgi:chemotaxis protein histidine kinase CheA/ActR/RegA family two-component response regulator